MICKNSSIEAFSGIEAFFSPSPVSTSRLFSYLLQGTLITSFVAKHTSLTTHILLLNEYGEKLHFRSSLRPVVKYGIPELRRNLWNAE